MSVFVLSPPELAMVVHEAGGSQEAVHLVTALSIANVRAFRARYPNDHGGVEPCTKAEILFAAFGAPVHPWVASERPALDALEYNCDELTPEDTKAFARLRELTAEAKRKRAAPPSRRLPVVERPPPSSGAPASSPIGHDEAAATAKTIMQQIGRWTLAEFGVKKGVDVIREKLGGVELHLGGARETAGKHVRIVLDYTDTYTVEVYRAGNREKLGLASKAERRDVKTATDVYADNLAAVVGQMVLGPKWTPRGGSPPSSKPASAKPSSRPSATGENVVIDRLIAALDRGQGDLDTRARVDAFLAKVKAGAPPEEALREFGVGVAPPSRKAPASSGKQFYGRELREVAARVGVPPDVMAEFQEQVHAIARPLIARGQAPAAALEAALRIYAAKVGMAMPSNDVPANTRPKPSLRLVRPAPPSSKPKPNPYGYSTPGAPGYTPSAPPRAAARSAPASSKRTGAKHDSGRDIAEIAKLVRRDIKIAFPRMRTSVTTKRYSMGQRLTVTIQTVPSGFLVLNPEWVAFRKVNPDSLNPNERFSPAARSLLDDVRTVVNQFNASRGSSIDDSSHKTFSDYVVFDDVVLDRDAQRILEEDRLNRLVHEAVLQREARRVDGKRVTDSRRGRALAQRARHATRRQRAAEYREEREGAATTRRGPPASVKSGPVSSWRTPKPPSAKSAKPASARLARSGGGNPYFAMSRKQLEADGSAGARQELARRKEKKR